MSKKAINAVANSVEASLEAQDLQLTMGGEPTFIPLEPNGVEWNNGAIGPEKLGYARRMARTFLDQSYPKGLIMQIFGKQYPNEPLPRWVVLTMGRNDGKALWKKPNRLLCDDIQGKNKHADGGKFIRALARKLNLSKNILPAYELNRPKSIHGWVLPLDHNDKAWYSEKWPFDKEKPLTLFPGDSQVGLRLPLWRISEDGLKRAVTVEVNKGALEIFIPPLEWPYFAELIGMIEEVAETLKTKDMIFCGYRPYETKGAITSTGLASDPGVLEVNVPPSLTWKEYNRVLHDVEKAANAEGLQTLKFNFNGLVQGSGGGAHIVFGGPDSNNNPFFKRPEIIAGMIRYWQHHPALAYFFTGQYVGPGSQAPRADETLTAKLYELETACAGIENYSGSKEPEFIDRLFSNLMTDSGGNTHRVEICLDKFWNSISPSGQLGLVELRAFETMPNVWLQSLTGLFIRAIIARLSSKPFTEPLIRFGTALQDRYMLPSVIWEDLSGICKDLQANGLAFELEWLKPIFDFRFPVLGKFKIDKEEIVFRQALEPWPLMAEVAEAGFTSRVVDNSSDRIEVSVSDTRLMKDVLISVNGIAMELQQVGGNLAGGIRYKCANGWPALHPHIPIQTPLLIELISKKDGKMLAAANYHHWNPDGPVYDGRPKTITEANKRLKTRWRKVRVSANETRKPLKADYAEESKHTLDLRRAAWA